MKILVIGGSGMAGHMIASYFKNSSAHEVWVTARQSDNQVSNRVSSHPVIALDLRDDQRLKTVLSDIHPDVVVNTAGILNLAAEADVAAAVYINSWVPHRLAEIGKAFGFRLIHISTDCVFSGERGHYTESDTPDGTSVYARTKFLGEVKEPPCLTIRTSIIGPEIRTHGIGLIHWFMHQTGTVRGYQNVWWNGITTLELAKAIEWSLLNPLSGLVHLTAPEMVSKYQLLLMIQREFNKDDVFIQPDDEVRSDRTLVNTRSDVTWDIAAYRIMLREMKQWMDTYLVGRYNYG